MLATATDFITTSLLQRGRLAATIRSTLMIVILVLEAMSDMRSGFLLLCSQHSMLESMCHLQRHMPPSPGSGSSWSRRRDTGHEFAMLQDVPTSMGFTNLLQQTQGSIQSRSGFWDFSNRESLHAFGIVCTCGPVIPVSIGSSRNPPQAAEAAQIATADHLQN